MLELKRFSAAENEGIPQSSEYCYRYLDSPLDAMSYQDFVRDYLECDVEDIGEEAWPDYEDYILSSDAKEAVSPIRYDYQQRFYAAGVHPVSHLHFGLNNEIRIAAERVWRPATFVLFVLRQVYPSDWKRVLGSTHITMWSKHVREDLERVPSGFRVLEDLFEPFLA